MPIELQATTERGVRLVDLAETLAEDFATRAGQHDKEGSYPFESIEALKAVQYFSAPIPEEFGGLGVTSVHDVVVASSRLARGDASVAIGVNMHLTVLMAIVRRWQVARAAGNERRTAAFGGFLEWVAEDGVVLAAAVSERSQDLTRPTTTAVRTESGWTIDGSKVFCTMSPAATVLYTAVSFTDDAGRERYGYAHVPTATPGVIVHDDWDALGMRASGSHSVTFEGVELPPAALRGGFDVGDPIPYMDSNLTAGLFHASSSLGIAEGAYRGATGGLTREAWGSTRRGRRCSPQRARSTCSPARPRSPAPRPSWTSTTRRTPIEPGRTSRSQRSSPRCRRRRRFSTTWLHGSSTALWPSPVAAAT